MIDYLTYLLYLIILILGFVAGLILAKLCKEEIKNWRKRFWIISFVCLVIGIFVLFINFDYKLPIIIALVFMIITSLTLIWKSYLLSGV